MNELLQRLKERKLVQWALARRRQQKLPVPPSGGSDARRPARRSAFRSVVAENYRREIVKIDNFFAELNRRNVIRMAGSYLVDAWLPKA